MRIVWNEQSVSWFRSASEYTGYNKKLAALLLEHIPSRKTLCDLGCGAGLIDLELAPHFERITCVDISREAVESVEKIVRERGIGNISTICSDAGQLDNQWDTVIALFHGGSEAVSKYLRLATDRLILAAHGEKKGGFGPEGHKNVKCFDVNGVKEHFDAQGVKYTLIELTLEYGQPFTDLSDAAAFVRAYSSPMSEAEMDAYLAERLEKTDSEEYPYYLPNQKKLGLFVIRREDNENF